MSTPSIEERLAAARAVASAAKLAAQRRANGGQHENGASSFASPFVDGGEAATKRLRSADQPEPSTASGSSGGTGATAAPVAAPFASHSSSVDGFLFKHSDDLVAKFMDGRTKHGNHAAILALLESLGAAGWPQNDQPDRNLCIAYLLQLRGVGKVSWSDSEKKFSVTDYTPSLLNSLPSWAAPEAPPGVAPESGVAKSGDAGSGDAESGDLNGSGGASSTPPALS